MKKLIFSILAPVLLLCGCNKQDSVTYSGMEAGLLAAGVFTSDSGTKMTVIGNENKYDVSEARRVLISYKTHPITDPSHIDIDLMGLMDALVREPFHVVALDDEVQGMAAGVSDAWFSGGYLNLIATVEGKAPNAGQHRFPVPFTTGVDGIVLRLVHESSEEIPAGSTDQFSLFLSVPMDEVLLSYEHACQAAGQETAYPVPVVLEWTDYVLEGGPLTLCERKGAYTPPASN